MPEGDAAEPGPRRSGRRGICVHNANFSHTNTKAFSLKIIAVSTSEAAQPPVWKRCSGFLLPFAGKAAATVVKEGGKEGWDLRTESSDADFGSLLPCHSSRDFQLFHFIYFSYLLPRFFPLSFSAPYHGALCFPHMAGLASALAVTLNGNAILSHLFCRSGRSAFRAKDLLLSRPIYPDAAVNLNMPCPCVIPSTGGQEFLSKQHTDQIFSTIRETKFKSKPHQFRLLILPYNIGRFAPTHQNKCLKICFVIK